MPTVDAVSIGGFRVVIAAAFLFVPASCSAQRVNSATDCTLGSFKEIAQNPAGASGKRFCAEIYAVRDGRTVRILENPSAGPQPDGLSVFATTRTRSLLTNVGDEPRRYYIEAIVHPQLPCFVRGGGECVPYLRPVTLDLVKSDPR